MNSQDRPVREENKIRRTVGRFDLVSNIFTGLQFHQESSGSTEPVSLDSILDPIGHFWLVFIFKTLHRIIKGRELQPDHCRPSTVL
jgi:hypothetical protein